MDFGPNAGWPGRYEALQRIPHVQALRVQAPEMLVIEHATDACAFMDPQHIGGREADVVVLQDKPSLDVLGALFPTSNPTSTAGIMIVIHATDMGDHHGLVILLHPVEHFGL